jgi:hypothetical protein
MSDGLAADLRESPVGIERDKLTLPLTQQE